MTYNLQNKDYKLRYIINMKSKHSNCFDMKIQLIADQRHKMDITTI